MSNGIQYKIIEGKVMVKPDLHVVPRNDWIKHNTDGFGCHCHPQIECEGVEMRTVVIHNSYDGREVYERGGDQNGQ